MNPLPCSCSLCCRSSHSAEGRMGTAQLGAAGEWNCIHCDYCNLSSTDACGVCLMAREGVAAVPSTAPTPDIKISPAAPGSTAEVAWLLESDSEPDETAHSPVQHILHRPTTTAAPHHQGAIHQSRARGNVTETPEHENNAPPEVTGMEVDRPYQGAY